MKESKFNLYIDNDNGKHIAYNSLSNAIIEIENKYLDETKTNLSIKKLSKEEKIFLSDNGFMVKKEIDEIKALKYHSNLSRYNSNQLDVVIIPSFDCNAKCNYCFQKIKKHYMTKEIADKAIEHITTILGNNKNIKKLMIVWFGGEPLLKSSHEIILYIQDNLKKYTKANDIHYFALVATNGYYATKERMKNLDINSIQITLDGTKQYHNKIKGIPIFDDVINNIKDLKNSNSNINISLRINITKNNIFEFKKLAKYLKSEGLNKGIYFYPARTVHYNENVKGEDDFFTLKEYAKIESSFLYYLQENGFKSLLPKVSVLHCNAQSKNQLVINPDGSIHKCVMEHDLCYDSLNKEDKFNNMHQYHDYLTYDIFSNKKCINCIALPVCAGGCPHSNVVNGKPQCTSFKYNLKDWVKAFYNSTIIKNG